MLERVREQVAVAWAPSPVTGSLTISEDGWLEGPGVVRVPSVRHFALTSRTPDGEPGPLGVCWHWTGGVCRPGYAARLAQRIRGYKRGVDRAASWHVVIAKQGWVYQSISFEQGAWHSAVGRVADGPQAHRVNRSLVGIELENAGRLRYLEGAWRCHPYWKARPAGAPSTDLLREADPALTVPPARRVLVAAQGAFDEFPDAQVTAAACVLRALVARYGLAPERCGFQHGDFEPRKEDAGPVWRAMLPLVYERAGLDLAAAPGGLV